MADDERRVLEQHRERGVGPVRFDAKATFLAGAAGLTLGFVWLGAFHFGDRGAPLWPIIALTTLGAVLGLPFDVARHRRQVKERMADAAARWDPVIGVGIVEHVVATVSNSVRVDDQQGNSAWFLQVDDGKILCVWDWVEAPCQRVELSLVPGPTPTVLKIVWSGEKRAPARPKRRFKTGEREPEQAEVLEGTLEQLDQLLGKRTKPRIQKEAGAASTLANAVEPLGFYKYTNPDQLSIVKAEIAEGAHPWYLAAGRAFDADCERLAEGGVGDLIDSLRPALETEGCLLGPMAESYSPESGGYVLEIGSVRHTMWNSAEAEQSWELTVNRASGLINQWLSTAGSKERLHLLHGGEDGVFVLLTPDLQRMIAGSGTFKKDEVPTPMERAERGGRR